MRQNKTSKKNRTTYIYDFDDGSKVELKPGVDDVTEMDVAMLHESDDEDFNEQRRYDYHVPVHYQAFRDDSDNSSEDGNAYLADDSTNPESILIEAEETLREERTIQVSLGQPSTSTTGTRFEKAGGTFQRGHRS